MSEQLDSPIPFSCTVQLEGQAVGEYARNAIRAKISEATAGSTMHGSQDPFLRTLNALMDDSGGCILTNEGRLVPILLYERHANAKPVTLIQINAENSECIIHLYPHLTGQGCTSAARLSLVFTDLLTGFTPALPEDIQSLRWYCDGGIPVGLHAHESLLRSSNSETHFPETETQMSAVALALRQKVLELLKIKALLCHCLGLFRWDVFFNGHDCYESGMLTNIALQNRVPCANFYKNEVCSVFEAGTRPYSQPLGGVLFSRIRNVIESLVSDLQEQPTHPAVLAEELQILNCRLTDLNTLSYMRVSQKSVQGFALFKDLAGAKIPEDGSTASGCESEMTWIFCFHSFSDQAHYYGLDGFESHFQFFLEAANIVHRFFPSDLIVCRPHPNTLGYVCDPEFNGTQGTAYMDLTLQAELTKRISSFHPATQVSGPLVAPKQLLTQRKQVVVTRWGNIAIEAAVLGVPSLFSTLAPYSGLFSQIFQVPHREALISQIQQVRSMHLLEIPLELPCVNSLADYQRRLSTREDQTKRSRRLASTDHFNQASRSELPLGSKREVSRDLRISRYHQLSAATTPSGRSVLKKLLGLI